jgi:hypothetical protein
MSESESEINICPTNNYNTMIIVFLIIIIIVILGFIYFNYTECNKMKNQCVNNTETVTEQPTEQLIYSSNEQQLNN